MLSMQVYATPSSLDEAYDLLYSSRNNVILGGCGFLRLGNKRIGTGIDLKKLKLDYIQVQDNFIEIGAMTSLRRLETHIEIKKLSNGILSKAISSILGVPFRNTVTIGGSVYGKFGFSDILTALLAMETELIFHKAGKVTLEEFLNDSFDKDILISVRIAIKESNATYIGLRHSGGDFPILSLAVSKSSNSFRISVGARPMRAVLAKGTMEYIANSEMTKDLAGIAAKLVSEEIVFGSNMRASASYRRQVARTLVERSLLEVCKI